MNTRARDDGFTLVELMMVVAIIGILASVAIPGFTTYIKRTRTVEAVGHVQKLWAGSVSYYETDRTAVDGTPLPKQFPGSSSVANETSCCSYSDGWCPANPSVYDAADASWSPWRALNFNIPMKHKYWPIYFAFPTPQNVWIQVQGDQNCDGVQAQFNVHGDVVDGAPHRNGVYITNELE